MSTSRVRSGVPTGGQFAAKTHAEPDVTLVPDQTDAGDPFAFDGDLDWDDSGFHTFGAERWAEVGVASPEVARRCADAGLLPRFAAHPWKTFDTPGEPPETISIGRAVETGIIDDLDLHAVSAWIMNRSRAHTIAASGGESLRHRRAMKRVALAEAELRRRGLEVPEFVGRPLDPHGHGH